ncbi:MAG TPA: tetratricopeptide repeat protein [Gaiellaceae bacterium]|nr:tetratricopeptide repeat protein [Gaiellaceae bacterium]
MAPEEPFSVIRLDDVEAMPTFGELKWKPLRRPLGVTAFGVNAYWAEKAGDELIEPHNELGAGAGRHEELYVVIGGSARFTVAGKELDAPPRTVVFVRDPAVRRGAVATEPNTTALAVGGVSGQAYRVSPWESVAHAIPAWRNGDYPTARTMIEDGLKEHPDNPSLLYELACVEALDGDAEAALGHLRRAVELKPDYAKDAQEDEDFASIRARPDFPA